MCFSRVFLHAAHGSVRCWSLAAIPRGSECTVSKNLQISLFQSWCPYHLAQCLAHRCSINICLNEQRCNELKMIKYWPFLFSSHQGHSAFQIPELSEPSRKGQVQRSLACHSPKQLESLPSLSILLQPQATVEPAATGGEEQGEGD